MVDLYIVLIDTKFYFMFIMLCLMYSHWYHTIDKKLGCRTETARRFVSLNILLSH